MQLDVRCYHETVASFAVAINDAVLSRGAIHILFRFYCGLTAKRSKLSLRTGYSFDGSNSTGYAMAAGGPIDPALQLMLITPICPYFA